MKTLVMNGKPCPQETKERALKERVLVILNGEDVWLTMKCFVYLFKLAYRRLETDEGWLPIQDLEIGDNQARNMFRLRSEIPGVVIENNRKGYYRLAMDRNQIGMNRERLELFPDIDVSSKTYLTA